MLHAFECSISSGERKSERIKCRRVCSNTASSVIMWFREGAPRAEAVSLPLVWNLLECYSVACSTFCATVEVLSEK